MKPTFSIVMTSYNYVDVIGDAIESVIAQTCPAWELIIVDDVSPDGSWDLLQRYAHHPQISIHRNESNIGGASTYNRALSMSTGRLVANLDSDDRWLPTFLERQLAEFSQYPELAVGCAFVRGLDVDSQPLDNDRRARWFNQDRDLNDPASWVWTNPVCHSSAVIRHDAHSKVGPLRGDYFATPDWDLWIRCLAAGHRFALIPEVLVESRVAGAVTHTAPERLSLEYAEISSAALIPLLLTHGRRDTAVRLVAGFFGRPEFRTGGPDVIEGIVRRLMVSGADLVGEGMQAFAVEQARIAARRDSALANAKAESAQAHAQLDLAGARLEEVSARLETAETRLRRIESSAMYRAYRRLGKIWAGPSR